VANSAVIHPGMMFSFSAMALPEMMAPDSLIKITPDQASWIGINLNPKFIKNIKDFYNSKHSFFCNAGGVPFWRLHDGPLWAQIRPHFSLHPLHFGLADGGHHWISGRTHLQRLCAQHHLLRQNAERLRRWNSCRRFTNLHQ
jgi:hypothetical protein